MPAQQLYITTVDGRRRFACSAVAVLVFIVNERQEILLLAHPRRKGWWEVVNGALEAGETILACALRETREEAGPIKVRPLGTLHASTFHYDENVQYMVSLCYLMAYEGGQVQPGDDMAGSRFRWWSLEELADESVRVIVPPDQKWLVRRAVELYRLWKGQAVELEPEPSLAARNKYAL